MTSMTPPKMARWTLEQRYTLTLLREEFGLEKNDPRVFHIWTAVHGKEAARSAETLKGDYENKDGEKRGTMYNNSIDKPLIEYTAKELTALENSRAAIFEAISSNNIAFNADTIRPFRPSARHARTAATPTPATHSAAAHDPTTPGTSSARKLRPGQKKDQINWTDDMRRVILILKPRVKALDVKWDDLVGLFRKVCADDLAAYQGRLSGNMLGKQSQESTTLKRAEKYKRLDPAQQAGDHGVAREMQRMEDRVDRVEAQMASKGAEGDGNDESDHSTTDPDVGGSELTAETLKMGFASNFIRHKLDEEQQLRFFAGMFPMMPENLLTAVFGDSAMNDSQGLLQPTDIFETLCANSDLPPQYNLEDAFDDPASPIYFLRMATFKFGGRLQMLHRSEVEWRDNMPTISHLDDDHQVRWFIDQQDEVYKYGGEVHRLHVVDTRNNLTIPSTPLVVDMDVMLCDSTVCDKCSDGAGLQADSSANGNPWIHAMNMRVVSGSLRFHPQEPQVIDTPAPASFRNSRVVFYDGIKRETLVCKSEECESCSAGEDEH